MVCLLQPPFLKPAWRYRDEEVGVLLLQDDGRYSTSEVSVCLPDFPIPALNEALDQLRDGQPSNAIVRGFAKRITRIE